MRLIAITTCTTRKRAPVPVQLDAANLPVGSEIEVAEEWRKRVINSGQNLCQAKDVYCGRSFQEALLAVRGDPAAIWIISGGLGLVRGTDPIPGYDLSLVPGSSAFIGRRIAPRRFDATAWWKGIQRTPVKLPIAELVRSQRDALALLGLSAAYLPLVQEDILSLGDADLSRVRIVGLGIGAACPARLQHCVLPYDDRLDGPDSPIQGTRGDFASRAMRHFAETVFASHPGGSLAAHRSEVERSLSSWARARRFARHPKTDGEIIAYISQKWNTPGASASRALRHLRDCENVACEQGRFRNLFLQTRKKAHG